MLQVLETVHLIVYINIFLTLSLQILNDIYKKFKKGKIPNSFLLSLFSKKIEKRSNFD
jgi:hypothetical protein